MVFHSKLYAGIFSMYLSSCAQQHIAPIPPTYPFKIEGYYVFIDNLPGSYDIITIFSSTKKQKYCYFLKETEDGDYLVINDPDCDLYGDRVIVLSGDKMLVAVNTEDLDKKVAGMLNYILRNHKKNILE